MRQNTAVSRDEAALGSFPTDSALRAILRDVLGLDGDQVAAFEPDSGLFGSLPELDSMAVAGLLTEIEDRLAIVIDDDEVDGELLETYGNLLAFVEAKRSALPDPG
ncbi:MAG: acyl carrier protein [Novosphingobium sp.]